MRPYVIVAFLLLILLVPGHAPQAMAAPTEGAGPMGRRLGEGAYSRPARALDELEFSTRISPAVVEWFNEAARPTDVASFVSRDLSLLDQVTAARKQVIFASAAEAQQMVPDLAGQVDIIGYNLEHWANTPAEEQADPVAAVQGFSALADQYGMQVAVGPDRRFTADYGVEIAPFVDIYVLQLQRLQGDTEVLHEFADPLIQSLRQANPNLRIVVQLRSDTAANDLLRLIDSLKDGIDGVALLTNASSLAVAQEVLDRLQAGGPLVAPTAVPEDDILPPLNTGPTPTPWPMPQPSLPPMRIIWLGGLIAAALALGGLFSAAVLLYVILDARNRPPRARRGRAEDSPSPRPGGQDEPPPDRPDPGR